MLSAVADDSDLIRVIDAVSPSIDVARALYRVSMRCGDLARGLARWLLAGAYGLEGLDDVAHAIEAAQRATGFVNNSYTP